jgi:hypothetical protein
LILLIILKIFEIAVGYLIFSQPLQQNSQYLKKIETLKESLAVECFFLIKKTISSSISISYSFIYPTFIVSKLIARVFVRLVFPKKLEIQTQINKHKASTQNLVKNYGIIEKILEQAEQSQSQPWLRPIIPISRLQGGPY